MFASDRAAECQGEIHHLAEGELGTGHCRLIVTIKNHKRVEVAVAGVPDGGDERFPDARPRRSTPATSAGTRGRGTPTSSMSTVPILSTAGIAILRAAIN